MNNCHYVVESVSDKESGDLIMTVEHRMNVDET